MLLTLTGCTIKSTTPKKAKSSVKTVKVDKQQSKEKQAKYQVMLQSGKILMVETKGDHLDNDESKEKAKIGDQ